MWLKRKPSSEGKRRVSRVLTFPKNSRDGITIGWDLKPCLSQAEISAMPSHAINKNINPGIRNRWGGRFQDVSQSQRFLCGGVTMEMGIRPIIGSDCRNCFRAQDTSQSKGWCLRAKLNMAMTLCLPREKTIPRIQNNQCSISALRAAQKRNRPRKAKSSRNGHVGIICKQAGTKNS